MKGSTNDDKGFSVLRWRKAPAMAMVALVTLMMICASLPAEAAATAQAVHLDSATLYMKDPHGLVPYQCRGFNSQVIAAIDYYVITNNSYEINTWLRNATVRKLTNYSTTQRLQKTTYWLDYAEKVSFFPEDMVVYKGISGSFGDIITTSMALLQPGFDSTSWDITVCYQSYAGPNGRDSEGYANVLVIPKKKGDHGLYTKAADREMTLPRNGAYDVIKIVKVDKLYVKADFKPAYAAPYLNKVKLIYMKPRA